MDTIIKRIGEGNDEEIYEQAAYIIRNGGLVAFPTETVYGLGANALDENAAAAIYKAKGRPSDNPLIVHISEMSDVEKLACDISDKARILMDKFWPGPMTLVMKKKDIVPFGVTGGLDTVAIRMPSHEVARNLIRSSGCYIAAPSANTSGKPSPTRAAHVIEDMQGKIDMIIADDTVDVGLESTIIDVSSDDIQVLRPGTITLEMISGVIGKVELDPAIAGDKMVEGKPKAPGMKYRHYAPSAQLTIVEGNDSSVIDYINKECSRLESEGKKTVVLATDESVDKYVATCVKCLGDREDEAAIARSLYAALRECDEIEADYIFSESFSREDIGQAIMNRLIKAAGYSVIKL